MTSASKENNPFLAAALAYAARGWAVFPLFPKDKKPITDRGFHDATTDRHRVLQWWQGVPDANIGLPTGLVFDVLDIDGPSSVPALREILGADYIHAGPVARTGKGKHLFFLATKDARNRAGLLGGKVDYRGAGGYVVGAPSIHPSGKRYEWETGRDYNLDLPVLPKALRDLILQGPTKEAQSTERKYQPLDGDGIILSHAALRALGRENIQDVAFETGLRQGTNGLWFCWNDNPDNPECGHFGGNKEASVQLYTEDNHFFCHQCGIHGYSDHLRERRWGSRHA